jgi:hypothetical protein
MTNHPLINILDDEENVNIPLDLSGVQANDYGFPFEYGIDSVSDYCFNSFVLLIPSDICKLRDINVLLNTYLLASRLH